MSRYFLHVFITFSCFYEIKSEVVKHDAWENSTCFMSTFSIISRQWKILDKKMYRFLWKWKNLIGRRKAFEHVVFLLLNKNLACKILVGNWRFVCSSREAVEEILPKQKKNEDEIKYCMTYIVSPRDSIKKKNYECCQTSDDERYLQVAKIIHSLMWIQWKSVDR